MAGFFQSSNFLAKHGAERSVEHWQGEDILPEAADLGTGAMLRQKTKSVHKAFVQPGVIKFVHIQIGVEHVFLMVLIVALGVERAFPADSLALLRRLADDHRPSSALAATIQCL